MSFPAGKVYNSIAYFLPATSLKTEGVEHIWERMNYHLFELCRQYSWDELRPDKLTLDFGDMTDETGLYLPSDLFGIDYVVDADDDTRIYWPRDAHAIQAGETGLRFATYQPETTALKTAEDLIVLQGSGSVTSATLSATDYTDEYIQVGDHMGFWKLTAQTTISPVWSGNNETRVQVRVRPRETRKMILYDGASNVITDRTVYVHYWRAPQEIFRATDPIPLPSTQVLEWSVLQDLPESKSRKKVNDQMVKNALGKALRANQPSPAPIRPRGRHGKWFTLHQNNMYQNRHDEVASGTPTMVLP